MCGCLRFSSYAPLRAVSARSSASIAGSSWGAIPAGVSLSPTPPFSRIRSLTGLLHCWKLYTARVLRHAHDRYEEEAVLPAIVLRATSFLEAPDAVLVVPPPFPGEVTDVLDPGGQN